MVVVALLVIAACGGGDETDVGDADETPTPKPTVDPIAACAMVFDGGRDSILERIPVALAGIDDELTPYEVSDMQYIDRTLTGAAEIASPESAAAFKALGEPFAAVANASENGREQVSVDTASVMTNLTDAMQTCVDAGYVVEP